MLRSQGHCAGHVIVHAPLRNPAPDGQGQGQGR
ncbi:hypothetical protein J2Z77_003074 [Streptomyces avidinii]|uniref:Uncharacterized protein n=1 Tax=Streptomyces avidinii TaxID=1895 RepID=A0ABS4L591_STRAV|nr:hypothetical protein [Streptomyces avidinii]